MTPMLRDLILARVQVIKEKEHGFSKDVTRWKNYYYGDIHVSDLIWENMDDVTLIDQFEMLIFKYYKQT